MPFARLAARLLAVLLIAGLAASASAASLPPAFKRALKEAGIPAGHVAVVVQPLDAAKPLLSYNADAAMSPASVMKLVTSFAALEQLGPDYVWTTAVWADGPVVDGVLMGNLVIRGAGDPTLTLERMWLLQRELRARGVRHVRGNLVLDLGDFDTPPADPAAFDDEPLALYNAAPGPLVANFNALTLHLKPHANGVTIVPDVVLPGVTLTSQLVLQDAVACGDWKDAITPSLSTTGAPALVLDGAYPRACGEQSLSLNVFGAATTFDLIFRGLWAEAGGTLDGKTLIGAAPAAPPLLEFASEPLAAALVRQNKYSNNLMARSLFLTLGAEAYGAPATPDKGMRAVREDLARRGVPIRKLVLENGAGLSRIERISAAALNQLLLAAYRSPLFAEFESSLPIVAFDGTLRHRFGGSSLAGHAHLKTGTLRDVSALAGYVDAAAGRRVSFVMLVNDANARGSEAAQRALLEWVKAGMPVRHGGGKRVR